MMPILPEMDATIETTEYSDGFGRLLQTRAQAEDLTFGDPIFGNAGLPADQSLPVGEAVGQQRAANDPLRVIVSGWQYYDNKGRVVEKYEPFFSKGFDYQPPADAELGQKTQMYYDPRGQVISDAAILTVFDPPPTDWQVHAFRVDWQPPNGSTLPVHAGKLLDATAYRISFTYDALNHVKRMRYPQDVEGQRRELLPHYNQGNRSRG